MTTPTKYDFREEITSIRKKFEDVSFWQGDKPREALAHLICTYINANELEEIDIEEMARTTIQYDLCLALAIKQKIYKENA